MPGLEQEPQRLAGLHPGERRVRLLHQLAHHVHVDPDVEQVLDVLLDGQDRASGLDHELRLGGLLDLLRFLGGDRDDRVGIPRDGDGRVDVQPVRGKAEGVEPRVVGAPPDLLDPHGPDDAPGDVPSEEVHFPPGQQPFGGGPVGVRGLHREERGDLEVGEEPEERLRALGLVEPFHAEVLERRQGIDDDPAVKPADRLHLERLHEGAEGDLDARELARLADLLRHVAQAHRRADRRDVLERGLLVAHDVGDGVEDPHLLQPVPEPGEVLQKLVRGLLEGDVQNVLALPDPPEQEL